jgi:hypothetical protein
MDGKREAIGSQEPIKMATPTRSSGDGPCVSLSEKTRSPESGSATMTAPIADPATHSTDRQSSDLLLVKIPSRDLQRRSHRNANATAMLGEV